VEIVWNQCDEVVDVSVPIAVEGSSEKHSCVVVEKHEAHVVESSNFGCTRREVATQQLEERTQPLRAARRQRNNDGQLRALAQTRPALSIGGGGSETCDVNSRSTFSKAFFPNSGASAKSSRSCCIFASPV